MSQQAQPQGQDQGQTTPQGTASGQGPWADVLAGIPDEATRQAVDQVLREKVQPYVTQVENTSKAGAQLLQDLQSNPLQTYQELTDDLFGEEAAKKVTSEALADFYPAVPGEETPQARQVPQTTEQPETPAQTNDPVLEAIKEDYLDRQNQQEFEKIVSELREKNPDVPIKDHLFKPFLHATDGNVEDAFSKYNNFVETAKTELLGQEPPPEPPPTLGSGRTGGATPPPHTEKQYDSVGAAIEDWAADLRRDGQSIVPSLD